MKVVAVISQNSFLDKKSKEVIELAKQHEVQMKMLLSHIENEKKSFAEKLKPITDAVEKNLRESGLVTGELNDNRHIVIAPEQDAVYLCDHND
jgi:tRNA/tmRNA/rRNA uracil-C5-methylase (TrmA/RlmC/RlmD family)